MEKIVEIPDEIEARMEGDRVVIEGPEGELEREFNHQLLDLELNDHFTITTVNDRRESKALAGTWEAHLNNMFRGVTDGFEKEMEIVHVHFPMNVDVRGGEVVIENFLGEQKPRKADIEEGVDVEIEGDRLTIQGIDKENVGQTVGNIEAATRVGNKRDKRRFYDGIYLVEED